MEVNSLLFIFIFLPIFIGLMYFIKINKIRNIILIIFSILFYIANDIKLFSVLLGIILLTYFVGLYVNKYKFLYYIYLFVVVSVLCLFKYNNNLIMPLGISFYTFTSISYTSDVYYKKIESEKNLINLFSYLTFFIVITSGPIIRYSNYKEFLNNKTISYDTISSGLRRFIIGLFKKVVIANQLAHGVSKCLDGTILSFPLAWFGAICFMLELYYDFSGYSDMAIGIAKMLGFNIQENFNDPYTANSIKDFWHRWHISLSTWFKDYVYIPLGGNRVGILRWFINILIVWSLTGVWHGNTLNFLIWGLYNALWLILEKYIFDKIKLPKLIRIIFTQIIVLFGFLIFYCEDINQLLNCLMAMFGQCGTFSFYSIERLDILYLWPYILIALLFIIPNIKKIFYSLDNKIGVMYDVILVMLLCTSIIYIVNGSYVTFIYAGF